MNYTATVKNGSLVPYDPIFYRANIQDLEGREVEVTVSKAGRQRTNPQNNYYFGVVVKLIRDQLIELGYNRGDLIGNSDFSNLTTGDVHDFLRDNFNRTTLFNPATGAILGSFGSSTKDLQTDSFAEYIERVVRWASETLSIEIPEPDIRVGYAH